jgi:ubiquinone/menaquinone biosynthesis C-methylase UbiE
MFIRKTPIYQRDFMEEPLYRDGRHYDIQNLHLTEDFVFYLHHAKQFGSPILELACGTGRITIPIVQQGFEIVGIDKSEKMLSRAKKKSGEQIPDYLATGRHSRFRS